jgi:hypothetical protein
VTGGRDRQEFGEALDEAHDDRFQGENDVHDIGKDVKFGKSLRKLERRGPQAYHEEGYCRRVTRPTGGFFAAGKIACELSGRQSLQLARKNIACPLIAAHLVRGLAGWRRRGAGRLPENLAAIVLVQLHAAHAGRLTVRHAGNRRLIDGAMQQAPQPGRQLRSGGTGTVRK